MPRVSLPSNHPDAIGLRDILIAELLEPIDVMVKEGLTKEEFIKKYKLKYPQIIDNDYLFDELLKERGLH